LQEKKVGIPFAETAKIELREKNAEKGQKARVYLLNVLFSIKNQT